MEEHPHVVRLGAYRLAHDLTYDQLAAEMAAAGYRVSAKSLHLAITKRHQVGPLERTLYKITQFVESRSPSRRLRTDGRRKVTPRKPRRPGGGLTGVP